MKSFWMLAVAGLLLLGSAYAQERIYRCGNEYTNTVSNAQAKGCKLVEGVNITVVPGPRPSASAPAASRSATGLAPASAPGTGASGAAAGGSAKVNPDEQKARDTDARRVLEVELKKAEQRQAELLREYNNGEPEKRPEETRNFQKYLDRIAELKASLARNESDIAGIRRELARLPALTAPAPARALP